MLGLIQVMENLSEPHLLGSGIAVAFVATIYGVGFANLVCLPIAGKLKVLSMNNWSCKRFWWMAWLLLPMVKIHASLRVDYKVIVFRVNSHLTKNVKAKKT